MTRLAISVEGKTEQGFVNRVLAGHLRERGVEPTPILLGHGRGHGVGGGNVSVERLTSEMVRLFRSFDAVTSLVDFYGFRRKGNKTPEELEQRIHTEVRGKVGHSWNEAKVIPYVQQYEFEGLLFSDVNVFTHLSGIPKTSIAALQKIRSQFATPEEINDNRDTAPSKRIAGVIPRYRKVVDGPLLAMETGLTVIRNECRRFDQWVARLESLGNPD